MDDVGGWILCIVVSIVHGACVDGRGDDGTGMKGKIQSQVIGLYSIGDAKFADRNGDWNKKR